MTSAEPSVSLEAKVGGADLGEFILLVASMLLQSAGSGEPVPATGAWSVDYGDDACTLSRSLGSNRGTFALRREDIARQGAVASLVIPDKSQTRSGQFKGSFLVDGSAPINVETESRPVPDGGGRTITAYLNTSKLAKLTSAGKFAFPVARNEHLWLNMESFDEALAALSKCSDDLVTSLGVPVAELDAVAAVAEPIGTIDLSPRRFPPELKGQYWEAQSKALFEIDVQGKVAGCRVISYSGPESLRESACEQPFLMRFKPARSSTEAPVRSWVVLSATSKPCVGRPIRSGEMTC